MDRPERPGRLQKARDKNPPTWCGSRGYASVPTRDKLIPARGADRGHRTVQFSTRDGIPAARATGDSPKGRRVGGVYSDLERHGMRI
jgi:hypothetical protein